MKETVRLRLVRHGDAPAANPQAYAYDFGLQDQKQGIDPGTRRADGAHVFDFVLQVKPGPDADRPVFTGPHASGPADDRFVYLSWRAVPTGEWINRAKLRLAPITWADVRAAQARNRPLTADVTGRGPGDARKPIVWALADD